MTGEDSWPLSPVWRTEFSKPVSGGSAIQIFLLCSLLPPIGWLCSRTVYKSFGCCYHRDYRKEFFSSPSCSISCQVFRFIKTFSISFLIVLFFPLWNRGNKQWPGCLVIWVLKGSSKLCNSPCHAYLGDFCDAHHYPSCPVGPVCSVALCSTGCCCFCKHPGLVLCWKIPQSLRCPFCSCYI